MTTTVEWAVPPPRRPRGRPPVADSAIPTLQQRPGKWAVVQSYSGRKMRPSTWRRPGVEVAPRYLSDEDRTVIYARWVGIDDAPEGRLV